jgi:molecular chaperone GrpE
MAENNENELIEEIDQKPDENSEEAEIENSESDQQNLQEVIEQHWDKILRLQAEIENLRKRNIKDVESAAKASIERVIQEMLPVIDSFEIGMTIDTKTDEGIETFIAGQKATYKQFMSMLDKFSIEEIDPKDMKFDSENHEAMSTVEDENTESGYIVEVIQKGYRLQNRLLRPARVIVSSEKQKD